MERPQRLIVIGASAGGMPALAALTAQLPRSLPAAVLVVQHLAPASDGQQLADRMARHTGLTCRLAQHGDPLRPGHLYLAPADHHLLVKDDHVLVTHGPHENHYRPAADALFRSAAVYHGPAVIGVVLTGMLHDGTAGLEFVKRCGGLAVVQDPAEAEFPSMPETALRNVAVDYVAPLGDLGALLQELVATPAPHAGEPVPDDLKLEARIAERIMGSTEEVGPLGSLSPLTCPDCGGTLWEMAHGQVLRYRCHTGHTFTAGALLESSQHQLEETLWVALRMMEERKNLLTGLAVRGEGTFAVQQEERLNELKTHVERLREFMLTTTGGGRPGAGTGAAARIA